MDISVFVLFQYVKYNKCYKVFISYLTISNTLQKIHTVPAKPHSCYVLYCQQIRLWLMAFNYFFQQYYHVMKQRYVYMNNHLKKGNNGYQICMIREMILGNICCQNPFQRSIITLISLICSRLTCNFFYQRTYSNW